MRTTPVLPSPARLPGEVRKALSQLHGSREPALFFGPCLRELMLGARPATFSLLTPLRIDILLARIPQAISILPERGILGLPTPDGALALYASTAGCGVQRRLANQDFTMHAIGWDGGEGGLRDPLGGVQDLTKGVLRTAGDALASFERFPLRALRCARLCAQFSLRPASDLLSAMRAAAPRLTGLHRIQLRGEIEALLLGPRVGVALDLLQHSGVAETLAPGVQDDAPRVVEQLPAELAIRLAGWLRGTRAQRILRRMGQPAARISSVEALLLRHPVDARQGDATQVVRLVRLPRPQRHDLFALRAAEIEARGEGSAARAGLVSLTERVDARERNLRVTERRSTLALDGSAVMAHLEIGPGPRVGAALQHLANRVAADPGCNEPTALRRLLDDWDEEHTASRAR